MAGATTILTPYAGLGLPDAAWAAGAGGSVALALWRWSDLRALAARPVPPAPDPVRAAERSRARLVAMVERLPVGREVLTEMRRQRTRLALRGSAVGQPWERLDRAAVTLAGLAPRLTGPVDPVLAEAAEAERFLRDLADRTASVEKAVRLAGPEPRQRLEPAYRTLLGQLEEGVTAYEQLVTAAAGYVAEDGQSPGFQPSAAARLVEARDFLHGIAAGLAELRSVGDPLRR